MSTHVAQPGRPREFDIDDAVRDAIAVFEGRGYHGTSIQDLVEGTGLARGSLYKAFRDKRSLFLAALEHYTAGSLQRIGNDLAAAGSARDTIQRTLTAYAERAVRGQAQRSCLVTAAAMELMPEDTEVGVLITGMFRQTENLFVAVIVRGQSAGDISRDHDPRAVARHLLCTMQGLRVLAKTGCSVGDITGIVDQAVRTLD